jgi:hypothetical protein
MKKLRLDHDDLRVESFATHGEEAPRGTVVGEETYGCNTYQHTCVYMTCVTGFTHTCGTHLATDCPQQSECAPYTQGPNTCHASCTDVEYCTVCGAIC